MRAAWSNRSNIIVEDRDMETTAVYWESKIKTYGFRIERDLSLALFQFNAPKFILWGRLIEEMGALGIKFNLVFGQVPENNILNVYLVVKEAYTIRLMDYIRRNTGSEDGEYSCFNSPIEMLSFQGPHYGDRYGIACTLFETLDSNHIPVIASCCSVSCIYLLLKEGKGDKARDTLLEKFEVPLKNTHRTGPLIG